MRADGSHVKKLTKLTTPLVALLALAACGVEQPAAEAPRADAGTTLVFSAGGRDRLCLRPDGGAGFITYAATSDANCSVRGRLAAGGPLRPNGDERCAIPVTREGDRITLGDGGPACAYYCGPSASVAGKTFVRMDNAPQAIDLAGEPLC